MKKLLMFALVMAFLTPAMAKAQSAFAGTWKGNMSKSQMPTKPDVYLLQNGMYQCKTCVPPLDIKADGQDQKVTGHPYYDTLSVKVVDDRTVEQTEKKDGKVVGTFTTTVAADGKTATFQFSDSTASNGGAPATGKGEMTRVAKGPAGSQAISGSWRTSKMEDLSDNGMTLTYKVDGDMLSMTTPMGQSYSARLDGTEAPYKGDPGTTSVSVKSMGKNMVVETDKRDGKVISITHISVSPDGKTMTFANKDVLHGTTSTFVADKQ
jgi:hypothetical protein